MTLPETIGLYLRTEATNTIAAVSTKSFWPFATQGVAPPFIAFGMSSSQRIATHMNGAGSPRQSTIDLKCYAESQSAAWLVAEAVKTDLDNYQGLMPAAGTVKVKRCVCTDEADVVSAEALESGLFAVQLTFTVVT